MKMTYEKSVTHENDTREKCHTWSHMKMTYEKSVTHKKCHA